MAHYFIACIKSSKTRTNIGHALAFHEGRIELEPIRVGVIGCGKIAESGHLPAYMRVPGVAVQAIADINKDRLKHVSDQFKIERCYTHFEDLLQNETEINAVSICLPTYLHKDVAIACFEAGKHVLCEKPLALDTKEGNQMIRSAGRHGVKLYVGFCLRFSSVLKRLKSWVQSAYLGHPLKVKTVNVFPRKMKRKSWYFDRAKGGGALFDMGPHAVDLLCWMFGHAKVTSAKFEGYRGIPKLDIESTVDMAFRDGLEGQLHVSWRDLPSQQIVEVQCTEGTFRADLIKSTLRIRSRRRILGRYANGFEMRVEQTLPCLHDEIWHFMNSMVDSDSEEHLATGSDGLRALRIITSAYEYMHG